MRPVTPEQRDAADAAYLRVVNPPASKQDVTELLFDIEVLRDELAELINDYDDLTARLDDLEERAEKLAKADA